MIKETSRSPSRAEVLRLAIKQNQAELHVSMPGRIESYDVTQQRADIKPLLKRPLVASDGTVLTAEVLPIIHDVPIKFDRGGSGFFITFPLVPGDHVHLIFNERSIGQFVNSQGEDTDPQEFRMHNLSDCVAYPGFYPFALSLDDAHADNLVIGKDGGIQIHLKPAGEIHLGSENAAEFVALAAKTDTRIGDLETAVSTIVTAHANVHTHIVTAPLIPGAPTPSATGLPTATAPTPGASVAATKVKAD